MSERYDKIVKSASQTDRDMWLGCYKQFDEIDEFKNKLVLEAMNVRYRFMQSRHSDDLDSLMYEKLEVIKVCNKVDAELDALKKAHEITERALRDREEEVAELKKQQQVKRKKEGNGTY